MEARLVKISKFLSLVLRHRPQVIGLQLGEGGWADVDELIAGANAAGQALDRPLLERVVAENDKRRFAFSPDGRRIRAVQGHSLPVELGLQAQQPPERLYHGTTERSLAAIRQQGLRPGQRQYVHLSIDPETARQVGARHGPPVVLVVAAGEMYAAGLPFYQAENGVWLTPQAPPQYLLDER